MSARDEARTSRAACVKLSGGLAQQQLSRARVPAFTVAPVLTHTFFFVHSPILTTAKNLADGGVAECSGSAEWEYVLRVGNVHAQMHRMCMCMCRAHRPVSRVQNVHTHS